MNVEGGGAEDAGTVKVEEAECRLSANKAANEASVGLLDEDLSVGDESQQAVSQNPGRPTSRRPPPVASTTRQCPLHCPS